MELSDRDLAVLDFEASWWVAGGSKEAAIKAELSLSPTSYYRIMATLTDSDEAATYAPLVVRRLRRSRDRRRRARYTGSSGRGEANR